ncbi:site-specific DNA-methyltransferase [Candidatus Synechococcus calcipolaris G9]|uniref:Methyltransferase n=1 Tax=Candidatus Synechococcus calcipolaris G9 TaxID=1497997 RepID=A0ABT6EZN2_9SYNE|nr:site-specific DNA-methyltransferase [Candidatus Synechococcus calcipolaris]MDG2991034.1 site-specific DNA-methyltransferase [Candidatus Synechococcus calcipolaris G9]
MNPLCIEQSYRSMAHLVMTEGDTLEISKQLPNASFQLIISSPPYNLGKSYEKHVGLDEYLDWQKNILREQVRLCSNQGSIVWQVGNYVQNGEVFPLDIYVYPIFKSLGMQLRNRIIWHFNHGLHASKRLSGRYEVLLWFTKTKDYTFNLDAVRVPAKYPGKRHYKGQNIGKPSGNPLGKNPSDFWAIMEEEWSQGIIDIPNVKSNHPEKTIHPCQFPVELVERCVLAFSNKGDWVLDPFGGVGSTLIAAIKHDRRGMIIERERQYIDIAKERINQFQRGELKLRPLGKPLHQPTGREKISRVPDEWIQGKSINEK